MRNVGAFVRLGWRDRANTLLDFFLRYRRPPGWRQWPEVVWREERVPHFIGDMPHTWVGSDFIRSVLDMFAYARESDRRWCWGRGCPGLEQGGAPVVVRGLPTPYGRLGFSLARDGGGVVCGSTRGSRAAGRDRACAAAGAKRGFGGGQRLPRGARRGRPVVVRALPAEVRIAP